MRDKYQATGTPFLSGFENLREDGYSRYMNFILSNGDRSKQIDEEYPTNYTFMMPADAHNKIRSVTIYYESRDHYTTVFSEVIHFRDEDIRGFSFFDKDGALLWKIGNTDDWLVNETVEIAENERIIGVKAKLRLSWQSVYTDFQFQIGKFVWRCD